MTLSLELMEEVQEVYAAQFALTILFIDRSGALMTAPKGDNLLCNKLLAEENSYYLDKLQRNIKNSRFPKKPVLYDIIPGVYNIIAPIENGAYYLCAGVFIRNEKEQTAEKRLAEIYSSAPEWAPLLACAKVITEKETAEWIQKISRITALLEGSTSKREFSYTKQVELIQSAVFTRGENMQEFLHMSFENNPQLDFLGLAEEKEDETFQVTQMIGEGQKLIGASFSPGESFLGRALLKDEEAVWKDIENDPRASLFKRFEFGPKSIYCYPLKKRNDTRALLFTGTVKEKELLPAAVNQGKVLAAILEIRYYTFALQQENVQQIDRLSSLIDVCLLMASTQNVKRIIYILVDISLNLAEGTFSSIISRSSDSDKIQLVSRGGAGRNIGAYAKQAAKRFYRDASPAALVPTVVDTVEGPVIECPLVHHNEILGVLSVGCHAEDTMEKMEEQQDFLQALSIIGAVSIKLARQEQADPEESKIETLAQAASQFDQAACDRAEKMLETADLFLTELDLAAETKEHIRTACRLSMYSPAFVQEMLPAHPAAMLIEQGSRLAEAGDATSWEDKETAVQITAVLMTYIEEGEDINAVRRLAVTEMQGVIHSFCVFMEEILVAEEEFALAEDDEENTVIQPFSEIIRHKLNLSPREQEVLELVLQGHNNSEIAKELFISTHTVKNHVTKVFRKLSVTDRAQAISKVYQLKYE